MATMPWEENWSTPTEVMPWDEDWRVPPEPTASGITKSAASAVPKGIFNLVGMFGGMNDLGKAASTWIMQKTGMSPEEIAQAMAARNQFDPMARAFNAMPNPQDVQRGVEKVTGKLPLYEPKTRAEKTVDTAVQLALGLGKPSAAMMGKVVLPTTAGTEIAGALTDDNHAARFAGGLLGGGGAAMANAYTSIPANTIRQAVGELTPAQIAAAQLRQAQAKATGVPLMGAESLPNSGIQQLASDVMSSRTGAPVVRKFLDQRPDQVRTAVGGLKDAIGPQMTPEAAAALAQEAATKAVKAAESARSAATSPFYQAARRDVVGPDALEGVSQALRNQRPFFELPAQQSALAGYQKLVDKKQGMNAVAMDNLYKAARGDVEVAPIGASSADKQAAAVLRPIVGELKSASEINSPALRQGRALHEQITRDVIDPLVSGPVGRSAGIKSGGFDPATTPPTQRIVGELSDPNKVRPETIRELYSNLNAQDKTAFPAVARTYLENAFDSATKRVQPGENVKMGANFANDVRGTDQQRANLDEIMRGVAKANGKKPDELVKGTQVLMDTLAATGKIPGTGSQTATRLGTQTELSRNPVSATADVISTRPLAMFARGADSLFNARRNRIVAEWLTAPNSVEIITKMAKLKPNSVNARFYLEQLLNANKEATASAQ